MAERAEEFLPYKVVPYEMGAASVIDRATGERVGYVLAAYRGWAAHLLDERRTGLIFKHHGITVKHYTTRYRRDAARKVWDVAQDPNCEDVCMDECIGVCGVL